MTGRRALLPALLAAALSLPGCDAGIRSDAEAGLEDGRRLTAAERARLRAVQRGEILREERPFYGAAVEVARGQVSGTPLPRRLEGARGVSLSLPGQADVETVAAAITAATDLPVNIRTRYVQADGSVVRVPIGTRWPWTATRARSRHSLTASPRGWTWHGPTTEPWSPSTA